MAWSRNPASYAEGFFQLMDVIEREAPAKIEILGDVARRLEFYAFRNAWRHMAQRAWELGNEEHYQSYRGHYEALQRYTVSIGEGVLILTHKGQVNFEIRTFGGRVEDTIDPSIFREKITVKGKEVKDHPTTRGIEDLSQLSPMLPSASMTEEQLVEASRRVEQQYEEILGFTQEGALDRITKSLAEIERRQKEGEGNSPSPSPESPAVAQAGFSDLTPQAAARPTTEPQPTDADRESPQPSPPQTHATESPTFVPSSTSAEPSELQPQTNSASQPEPQPQR